MVGDLVALQGGLDEAAELFAMAAAEGDEGSVKSVLADVDALSRRLEALEFQRMFSGRMDSHNCFVDIQAGAGGTDAQDWAEMLLRMYLKWCDARGWKAKLMEASAGEVAGLKSATFCVEGDHAYGWFKTETGNFCEDASQS